VEFQKILDHPGIVVNEPIGALAHKDLAHAYALMGQQDKARASYGEFMSLWHEADVRNPIFQEARSELNSWVAPRRNFANSKVSKTCPGSGRKSGRA
jgi:hypothetical protein